VLKKLLVIVAVLLLLVVVLASRDWDSPELGRAVLDEVGAKTGVQIQAEGFRLNLLKGVVLEKVQATSSSEGRKVDFALDRLVFEHRILPLLTGKVAIDRIVLEEPRIELVQEEARASKGSGKPAETKEGEEGEGVEGEPSAGGGPSLAIEQILIENGVLVAKNEKGEEKTRVEGLNLELRNVGFDPAVSSLAALSGEGQLSVNVTRFDALELRDTEGRFELKDAVFLVPELSFSTPHGRFVANTKVDFNPVPFTYELSARGEPMDLNSMVGAKEGFGPGSLELEAGGAGPETADLKADGEIRLAEGRFPAVSVFEKLDGALGKKVLEGSTYKATEAKIRVANNHVTLLPFRFETESARLELKGQMSLAPGGPIDLDLSLATPREGVQVAGVGSTALDLLADDEGWVAVPIDVTGTLESPIVTPNARALASQASQGAKREAKEKAVEALGNLFNRKKKP
jgi:hypothetical protein